MVTHIIRKNEKVKVVDYDLFSKEKRSTIIREIEEKVTQIKTNKQK